MGLAADIYSLGAMLYALTTGRPPFQAATAAETIWQALNDEPVPPRRLNRTIDRDLETICLKCLEKDPGRRYSTAEALADDLTRHLDRQPIVARRTSPAERARIGACYPGLASALAAIALITAGGLAGITWLWSEARAAQRRAEENELRVVGTLGRWYEKFTKRPEFQTEAMKPMRKEFLMGRGTSSTGSMCDLGDSPRFQRERVRAMLRVAQIHTDLQEEEQARAATRSAIEAAEAALRKDPASRERQSDSIMLQWAIIHEQVLKDALASYLRADEYYERIIQAGSTAEKNWVRAMQIFDSYNMGTRMAGARDFDEAGRLFRAHASSVNFGSTSRGPTPT